MASWKPTLHTEENKCESLRKTSLPVEHEARYYKEANQVVFQRSISDPQTSLRSSYDGGTRKTSKESNCGDVTVFTPLPEDESFDIVEVKRTGVNASRTEAVYLDPVVGRKASDSSLSLETDEDPKWKGMVKGHYVNKDQRKQCQGCQKQFTLKRRPLHCRRCGGVFCGKCVRYKRKLNRLAHPDPEGVLRKVCSACYEDSSLVFGSFRKLTEEFVKDRQDARNVRILSQRVRSLTTTFWRDQLDIRHECMRLVRGFKENVMHDGTALQEVRSAITLKTPEWQKSPYWEMEKQCESCRKCKTPKRVKKSSGICRVCGISLCKRCCNKDLLVYYPDTDTRAPEAMLAIINTEQCPEKEPRISLHLYVCDECRTYISTQQQISTVWFRGHVSSGIIGALLRLDADFRSLCGTLTSRLSSVSDRLERHSEEKQLSGSERRKQDRDLEGLRLTFDEYEARLRIARDLKQTAETNTQKRLLENFCRSKHAFFMEHRVLFRKVKNRSD